MRARGVQRDGPPRALPRRQSGNCTPTLNNHAERKRRCITAIRSRAAARIRARPRHPRAAAPHQRWQRTRAASHAQPVRSLPQQTDSLPRHLPRTARPTPPPLSSEYRSQQPVPTASPFASQPHANCGMSTQQTPPRSIGSGCAVTVDLTSPSPPQRELAGAHARAPSGAAGEQRSEPASAGGSASWPGAADPPFMLTHEDERRLGVRLRQAVKDMLGGSFSRVELDGIGRGMLYLGALSGEAAERKLTRLMPNAPYFTPPSRATLAQQYKPEGGCQAGTLSRCGPRAMRFQRPR